MSFFKKKADAVKDVPNTKPVYRKYREAPYDRRFDEAYTAMQRRKGLYKCYGVSQAGVRYYEWRKKEEIR